MNPELDPPPGVELRPAGPGDYGFAEKLYLDSTRPLLRALGSWDRAVVTRRFANAYSQYPSKVIRVEDRDIGWLQVSRNDEKLHLHQVHLLRRYRNRGIGTQLVRAVMRLAQAQGLPLTLNVIRGNPATRLYLRLGFRVVGEDTELVRMRWDAAPPERP